MYLLATCQNVLEEGETCATRCANQVLMGVTAETLTSTIGAFENGHNSQKSLADKGISNRSFGLFGPATEFLMLSRDNASPIIGEPHLKTSKDADEVWTGHEMTPKILLLKSQQE